MICCPAMDAPDSELLRRMAALAGHTWTAEEATTMAPLIMRALQMFARLDSMALGDVEPCVHFHLD